MHVEPDNLHEDVAAAMAAVETADTTGSPVVIPTNNPANDGTGAPVRGEDGKFVSSDPTKTSVPGQDGGPANGDDKGKVPNDPKQGSDVVGSEQGDKTTVDDKTIQLDPSKPPQGWRPEAKAKWAAIPEDIRQEIIRREENSAQGVTKLRQQYEPMEKVYKDVIEPAAPYLAHIQREPTEYLQAMIMSEQTLTLGNPAQKMEKLLEIADTYGVPIRQALDSAMGGKLNEFLRTSHEAHKTPPTLPPEVARELQESRQFREQMVQEAAKNEYDAFVRDAETKHPFFEDVKEDMAKLIETGVCSSYVDAYETAVWRNPEMRQREIARQNGISQNDALRQRQLAAGSISTPGAVPIVTGSDNPNPDESIEDSVRRAYASASGRT